MNLPKIEKLPETLGLPERYGKLAVGAVIEPDSGGVLFPEIARVYEMLPTEQSL